MCQTLVSPSKNPLRKQPYEAQIEHFKIPVKKRQLQRKMKEHTNQGGRYLMGFIKKIYHQNREQRTIFGDNHVYDPLFGFFDHIVYTDEAHVDPTSQAQSRITREQGTRDLPENIEECLPLSGARFH